jgi:hypothetical protein
MKSMPVTSWCKRLFLCMHSTAYLFADPNEQIVVLSS